MSMQGTNISVKAKAESNVAVATAFAASDDKALTDAAVMAKAYAEAVVDECELCKAASMLQCFPPYCDQHA
jgi:hypothetical protein